MNLSALNRGIRVEFEQQKKKLDTSEQFIFNKVTFQVKSVGKDEEYVGIEDVVSDMKEWTGDKEHRGFRDYAFTLENKDYYDGIEIDRNLIEDDRLNGSALKQRISSLTQGYVVHKNTEISALLTGGDTASAYDGLNFFSSSRTNNNLVAGTGVTETQILADLSSQRARMRKFQTPNGKILNLVPDTVIIPPELETSFERIIRSATLPTANAQGVYNVEGSMIKNIIVDPRLTDVNDWYVVSTSGGYYPFVLQQRKPLTMVSLDKPNDENVYNNRTYKYSIEARHVFGYWLPECIIKVTNT